MSHDHTSHTMTNATSHGVHMAHMDHGSMNHGNMDHAGMVHENMDHNEMCNNDMHGMKVRITSGFHRVLSARCNYTTSFFSGSPDDIPRWLLREHTLRELESLDGRRSRRIDDWYCYYGRALRRFKILPGVSFLENVQLVAVQKRHGAK